MSSDEDEEPSSSEEEDDFFTYGAAKRKKNCLTDEQKAWLRGNMELLIENIQLKCRDIADELVKKNRFDILRSEVYQRIMLPVTLPLNRAKLLLEHVEESEKGFFADFLDVLCTSPKACPYLFTDEQGPVEVPTVRWQFQPA